MLKDQEGNILTNNDQIDKEVVRFYKGLVGTTATSLKKIDILAMREVSQLSIEQRILLIGNVLEKEVHQVLMKISDITAPGEDRYGAKFFKVTWHIIKQDIIDVVQEFFMKERMYREVNITLITMIPKHDAANMVKDYRPISCC
ncbi:uncharacterized protein LOC131622271 [Vicia villosa]|uniref:uncharacterized protein LOC131614705 n=1 Tax=Vicia villosa TaxID=3911 RepID=UPI00273C915D|nr:uncharacterized protein LOC131614705 [Vicia villosa]XP_058749279.1 uncharacterized protein LOC131622271 [Vicia villosa]